MSELIYEPKLATSLDKRFKVVVILTADNAERSIQLANFAGKNTKVLYVTSERLVNKPFTSKNIEYYYFNDNFKKPGSLTYQYNNFVLAKKIGSVLKKFKIADNDMLLIFNNLGYSELLDYYKEAKAHFDCYKLLDEMEIIHSYNNQIYSIIRSYTASTMEIKQQLDKFFKPVFRIPDGVNIPDLVIPATKNLKEKNLLIGCYCPEINNFNEEMALEIAKKFPEHSFLYILPEHHSLPAFKDELKNLKFKSINIMNANYDIVIIPVLQNHPETINQYFYSNLIFNRPIYVLKNQDLELHKEFVKMFSSSNDLMDAITCYEPFINIHSFAWKFLLENSNWTSRLKHIESIILAYITY